MKLSKKATRQLILDHEQLKAKAKDLYSKMDEIQDKLIDTMGIDNVITLDDGRTAKIHNNFLDKDGNPRNVSWGHCGVRLHELKIKK